MNFSCIPSLQKTLRRVACAVILPGVHGASASRAAWTRVKMDLGPYTGDVVQFRFHFTSDGGMSAPGWYMDDFALEQDPVITLAATDPVAADGGNTGAFSLNLSPSAPGPLSVGYSIAGTAANGPELSEHDRRQAAIRVGRDLQRGGVRRSTELGQLVRGGVNHVEAEHARRF